MFSDYKDMKNPLLLFIAALLSVTGVRAQYDLAADTLVLLSPPDSLLSYADTARFEFSLRHTGGATIPTGTSLDARFYFSDTESFDIIHTTTAPLDSGDLLNLAVPPIVLFKGDSITFCIELETVDADATNNIFCRKMWVIPAVGIESPTIKQSIRTYRQGNTLVIESDQSIPQEIAWYNLSGQLVWQKPFTKTLTIGLGELPTGLLIYHITNSETPVSGKWLNLGQ